MGIGQIVAELNQAVCETFRSQIHKRNHLLFGLRKNSLVNGTNILS